MEEARPPAALTTRSSVGNDGASGRTSVSEVASVVRSPSTQIGAVAAVSTEEDWLYMATAYPAFWLKEVGC
jgi:hypothetical protein